MNDFSHIFFYGSDNLASLPRPTARVDRRASVPSLKEHHRHRDESTAQPDPLVEWLLEKAGVNIRAYRPQPLIRRFPACLRHLRTQCPITARNLLEKKSELVPAALDTLLIGVSEFFRDAPVFKHLQEVVIPELHRTNRSLRICSMGASSGQELYSIAILLAEAGALEHAYLLGVDCRPDAIQRARRGVFASLDGLPEQYRDKYFTPIADNTWVAHDKLRSHMHWQMSDVFSWDNRETWDLILFRNVAIYLKESHSSAAWEHLSARLVSGGYFVTGKAEVPPHHLPFTRSATSVYRKP